jgi:L-methionine (R)-S-oxide reductase
MAAPKKKTQALIGELEQLTRTARTADELMPHVVHRLHERRLKYNWVGSYMIEKGAPGFTDMLVLGAYVGAMTPHVRIPLHQGICGAAASTGKTVVVDDVSADPRYLACSVETKSEIVVPIFVCGKVVGELDIDSHFPSAFADEDRSLVEYCAGPVGLFLEQHRA